MQHSISNLNNQHYLTVKATFNDSFLISVINMFQKVEAASLNRKDETQLPAIVSELKTFRCDFLLDRRSHE